MNIKQRAFEIYKQHIELAKTDGRLFRKTVMAQIQTETGCTEASAATAYNWAKKSMPVEGLGRAPVSANVRKPVARVRPAAVKPDNECYSVIEIVDGLVGRYQSFELQGDASERFDERVEAFPNTTWVLIQGLGPNHGDNYRLEPDEAEIKRYQPVDTAVV